MLSLPTAIRSFHRSAWTPTTIAEDGPITASKFSGTPWIASQETWPQCGNCGQPMQLLLQLNLADLPLILRNEFGSGLLQAFYCTNTAPRCEDETEASAPFTISQLLRLVQPSPSGDRVVPLIPDYFPAQQITAWTEQDDYPMREESMVQGVELSAQEWTILERQGFPHEGDKLAGWPLWMQGIEYPTCPECGAQMRLVFQLDSDDHLPYQFGDGGCGHITQCPTHKHVLAFGWAGC